MNELCGTARDIVSEMLDGKELPQTTQAMLYGELSRIMNLQGRNMVMNGEGRVEIEEVLNQALNLSELMEGTIHSDILIYQVHIEVCLENCRYFFTSINKQVITEPLYRLAVDYKGASLNSIPHTRAPRDCELLLKQYNMNEQLGIWADPLSPSVRGGWPRG